MPTFTVVLMTKQTITTPLGSDPRLLTSRQHGVEAGSHLEALTRSGLKVDGDIEFWADSTDAEVLDAVEDVSLYIVEQVGGDAQFFDSQWHRVNVQDFASLCGRCLVSGTGAGASMHRGQTRPGSDRSDELHLLCRGRERVIYDCLARLEFFCEYDAFKTYDMVGLRYASESDRLHPELLQAMNGAMRARSSSKAWETLMSVHLPELAQIPTDVDLIECTDSEYLDARKAISGFYLRVTAAKWLTDMAASKMLFLKRPLVAAISDSYVREALMVNSAAPVNAEQYTDRALVTSDAVRQVGRANINALNALGDRLTPLMERITAQSGMLASLSKARIVDILIWSDEAIGKNQAWTREARSRGWHPF